VNAPKQPPFFVRWAVAYWDMWEEWTGEDFAFLPCLFTGGAAVILALSLSHLPFSIVEASARAAIYTRVTGHEVSTWEAYWVGDIPSLDVQVREASE